jgi:glycerol-3-phosphate dehydrogenase (NAD(P)+)
VIREKKRDVLRQAGYYMQKIAIIGGGSWGTALAIALTRSSRPHRLSLWVHSADVVEVLRVQRVNEIYLPGFELPAEVEVTGVLEKALAGAGIVLGVMPSAHAREIYRAMRPFAAPDSTVVSATKGLEPDTHARISEVIAQEMGMNSSSRIAVLSGPSFAREVAAGHPTAVVLAVADAKLASEVQEEFSGPRFRLYTNDDVIGTEIAGAVKNVIAIAAGICTGLELGTNAVAALVTRGLVEMTRLAVALGGHRETLSGLAGVGDLILTATGELSRNRSVGIELGKGRDLREILGSTRRVAEGVGSAAAALELAGRVGVEMPISEQVHTVLTAGRVTRDAIRELMERRLKQE